MPGLSLTKALIINMETGAFIPCMFNPTEYSFSKKNSWKVDNSTGKDAPPISFTSGDPSTLTMQLFFDTYAEKRNVRAHTEPVCNLMEVVPKLVDGKTERGRPPMVRFQWGKSWTFDAIITSITQKFTLFLDDGTPVRATLDVSFQQVKDKKQLEAQNPTSGGEGGERVWTVSAGDTLAWIAFKMYGTSTNWRPIAQANGLTNVRRLTPGMVLVIPND